jgi:hypothetical protein
MENTLLSDSDSSSSSNGSSCIGHSKFVISGDAAMHSSVPSCLPVSASSDAPSFRKEPKASYRTIRYFDEADASITCVSQLHAPLIHVLQGFVNSLSRCFNCGGCGHMSRECVQVAKPRPCNVCGATDHKCSPFKITFPPNFFFTTLLSTEHLILKPHVPLPFLSYILYSVHTCPNTPCFRCRLPGHRAKDCSNRRWPREMCWRCLRTDRHRHNSQAASQS